MVEFLVGYKIYNKVNGLFSKGVVHDAYYYGASTYEVRFDKNGKIWTKEKLLKDHLLKCAQHQILSDKWEIVQVVHQPTKPMSEWIDAKMLTKILKGVKS